MFLNIIATSSSNWFIDFFLLPRSKVAPVVVGAGLFMFLNKS